MGGLKKLYFFWEDDHKVTGFTSEIGNAVVQAFEKNTILEYVDFSGFRCDGAKYVNAILPEVDHLSALNRGGRRLLTATGESVPPLNYWPRILGRSSANADVLFYLLHEMHNVLLSKASSTRTLKRKREGGDETARR
jgi:hypothetical protein